MIEIKENVPLSPMTTFRIGGSAKYFVDVKDEKEIEEAVQFAKDKQINFCVIGGGSNILVNDKGFDGLVISLKLANISVEGKIINVDAGVALIKLVNFAAISGLSGLELLAGIPGTVGGAIRGNAGAFGGVIGNVVESVLAFDTVRQELISLTKEKCEFSYRNSFFKKNPQYIIVSARLELSYGDAVEIDEKVKATIAKRLANELSGEKSAGSYFMNPVISDEKLRNQFREEKGVEPKDEKLPSGWLIEKLDLKGKKIGGAMISEKHANYIINTGNATAEDVIMLESFVKQQVRDKLGVMLQAEVSYLGF